METLLLNMGLEGERSNILLKSEYQELPSG